MINYSVNQFQQDITNLCIQIDEYNAQAGTKDKIIRRVYGVPRGGLPVAIALSERMGLILVDDPHTPQTLIVDDLVDSGSTMNRFPGKPFACLHVKPHSPRPTFYAMAVPNEWINYFWEAEEPPIQDHIRRCLQYIGEDPTREGLLETPDRVVRAWDEWFAGYKQDPADIFKQFDGNGIGGLIYLKDIEFYSTCEHHMVPFHGSAMIAYIPNGKVIGVSKLARLLDIFSRRLQIQERIGEQITETLMQYLNPIGAACLIEAKHLCISSRGVKKQHSVMGYSSMKGVFLEQSQSGVAARAELMSLWSRA